MSSLTKKLFISVLTLIVTVGAFAATTFAWFTLGNQAQVGRIDANVQSAEGLDISLDGSNWKSNISSAEINSFLFTGAPDFTFRALTSKDGKSILSPNDVKVDASTSPALDEDYLTEGFIYFELHFRSNQAGVVKLSNLALTSNPGTFNADQTFLAINNSGSYTVTSYDPEAEDHSGTQVITSVLDAIRVSFEYGANVTVYESAASTTNTLTNATNAPTFAGAHSYFVEKGNALLGISKVTNPSDYESLLTTELGNIELPSTSQTFPTGGANALSVLTLASGVSQSIKVRVWVEGWDAQAYNAIFESQLGLALTFDFTPNA
ncbi:hypothetical protein [Acholeplasma hippikon]|uniref:SipW-cognate class signal peptide n=1 Tax=Acholeplasma hippikon TaxID=264636 RepID=A0A449BLL2_9MOLU|nr:hypothetical protein [Acholeplasma hippikon]VEU83326.1 Uncharacterised protein [Acholeplasma hippikon]